jgi:DNA-binding NarL/FixJ family response regulator
LHNDCSAIEPPSNLPHLAALDAGGIEQGPQLSHTAIQQKMSVIIATPDEEYGEYLAKELRALDSVGQVITVDLESNGLDVIKDVGPDLVLLNVRTSSRQCGLIKDTSPHTRVVAWRLRETDDNVLEAINVGCSSYVRRGADREEIGRVVIEAKNGRMVVSEDIFRRLCDVPRNSATRSSLPRLSPCQRDIVVKLDLPNKRIALDLGISKHTVKNHVHNILKKLQVPNRTAAKAKWLSALYRP